MPKTQEDLVNRALTLLNKVGEGETASEGDVALVDANVAPVIEGLAAEGIAIISASAIEDAIFLPLARILANESAPDFAQAYSEDVRAAAIMQINRALAQRSYFQPLATEYY